uniref:SAP domain-containing protein n=1 Tax=Nosema pernyi TaxID=1112939 RepID=X5E6B6_9MICR|nr:hypothetical protein NP_07D02 [Nosema pernyi]
MDNRNSFGSYNNSTPSHSENKNHSPFYENDSIGRKLMQGSRQTPNRFLQQGPSYENMRRPSNPYNYNQQWNPYLQQDHYQNEQPNYLQPDPFLHHEQPNYLPPTRGEPDFPYDQSPSYTDGINLIGSGPWYSRKKRKTNPLLWQYSRNANNSGQAVMHPSKYSSLDYIQGTETNTMPFHSPKRMQPERDPNNTVLALFLSSNKELTDEFKDVVNNFKQNIREIDFTNVTVQQLKIFMKKFGLNHTGKKNELIDRLKNTLHRIDSKCTGKKTTETSKNTSVEKEDEYGYYFF